MTESGLPQPAPAFAEHFTDALYDDVGNDLAPFGSDEGSDLLAEWGERRGELDRTSTLATVLGCEPSQVAEIAGPMEGVDGIETAMMVTSAAFVLLRLVGHLAEEDRRLALEAVDFQVRTVGDMNPGIGEALDVLRTQRDDLASWRNPG
jgi:uncharacterized protein YfeS